MTEGERQKFLPAVRKLTELLKKEKLEPEDIKSLGARRDKGAGYIEPFPI